MSVAIMPTLSVRCSIRSIANRAISADASTNEMASFQHPKAEFCYDTLPKPTISNRARQIERAASDSTMLLSYHWTHSVLASRSAEETGTAMLHYYSSA